MAFLSILSTVNVVNVKEDEFQAIFNYFSTVNGVSGFGKN
jgi:hypothetical protein